MPDMKRPQHQDDAAGDALAESLEAVSRDDDDTEVPAHVRAFVMRAWDTQLRSDPRKLSRMRRPLWFGALAASALLGTALWMQFGARDPQNIESAEATSDRLVVKPLVPSPFDTLATVDMVLDDDPSSFQLVQLSVQPEVLTAYGFPVADPADSRPVEIEVLIGRDGVPHAMRQVIFVPE
jgi:hypothetical protein